MTTFWLVKTVLGEHRFCILYTSFKCATSKYLCTSQSNTNLNPHFSPNSTSTCMFLSWWGLNARTTRVRCGTISCYGRCDMFTPVITSGPQLSVCHLSEWWGQLAACAQCTFRSADKQRARANTAQSRDPPSLPPPPSAILSDKHLFTILSSQIDRNTDFSVSC